MIPSSRTSNTLFVLVGATGSGKTALTQNLPSNLCEIVSFDSRQVYKDLSIGTTAPTEEEKEKIPHHLVSFLTADQKIDAKVYSQWAEQIILEIYGRGKIPVLVCGTGFYLRAFLQGMFPVPFISEEIKNKIQSLSFEEVRTQLKEKDPIAFQTMLPNDHYRMKQALEVIESGVLWSEISKSTVGGSLKKFPNTQIFGFKIDISRNELYERINKRAKEIIENGFLEETKSVANQFGEDCPGLQSLGYNFALDFLKGKLDPNSLLALLSQSHRNYAKKQETWFKKETYLWPLPKESILIELNKKIK